MTLGHTLSGLVNFKGMHKECVLGTAVLGAALATAGYALYKRFAADKSIYWPANYRPVLFYWPARGRAEQIRLALVEAGVEFQDRNYRTPSLGPAVYRGLPTIEEAQNIFLAECREKGGHLTTNVPMLFIDGMYLTQSHAILKYVGRRCKLYPSDPLAAYRCDNVIAMAEDLRAQNYKPMAMFGGGPKEKQAYINDILPTHLKNAELQLANSDGDFFCGSELTVADLTLWDALMVVECQVPGALKKYQKLQAFYERVENRPKIAAWYASSQSKALFRVPQL